MFDIIKNLNQEKIIAHTKSLGIAALCMTAVFIAGFGAGKMHSGIAVNASSAKRSLTNYNTNSAPANSNANTNSAAKPAPPMAGQADCYIKGSKSKIYHMPGGSFYDRTNADKCFATEAEAQAAGFTKSSR